MNKLYNDFNFSVRIRTYEKRVSGMQPLATNSNSCLLVAEVSEVLQQKHVCSSIFIAILHCKSTTSDDDFRDELTTFPCDH